MEITLDVNGMKCAGCVQAVERELTSYEGVVKATVNLLTEVAVVECDNSVLPTNIANHLTDRGFPATPRISNQSTAQIWLDKQSQSQTKLLRQLIIAGMLLGLSAIGHISPNHDHFWLNHIGFHWGLATLALLFPGREIITDGIKSLLGNRPNMNTLIGLGATFAYCTSVIALVFPSLGWECFFDEPVMMIGFITLGKSLEKQAKQKAALAIKQLLSLQKPIARLVSPSQINQSIEIPLEQVKINDWLRVLPGEIIPLDGIVKIGETTVDESIITGESLPVPKSLNSPVIGGSINQHGGIVIAVTHVGNETTLSQIISLVETAQTRKAPIQKFADYISGYFTYGVITLAIATFLLWSVISQLNPTIIPQGSNPLLFSLKMAITVLVIACPCALGLATPTAILVGTGIGATSGLLIKGGDILEKIAHVDTLVFDKTGTLTEGKLKVTEVIAYGSFSQDFILDISAIAETNSNHLLREAILQGASNNHEFKLISSQSTLGLGITAKVEDLSNGKIHQVYIGNDHWLEQHHIDTSTAESTMWLNQGKTPIYVGIDGELGGIIGISDQLRPESKETIKDLQSRNYKIVLLTGDRQIIADQIAKELGIQEVYAEVLPAQKAQIIQQLQGENPNKKSIVAMVGDGINDAPALAQADLGMALNAGTDIATATADIVLIKDSLTDVLKAIKLAEATFHTINQNLFWAVIYNLLAIPAAAGIFYILGIPIILTPAIAGAMMATSSISVVLNSLKLKWFINWQN